jgi:hypothetical protein
MQVRNARLAMLACGGFAVQAWVTGKGPIENAVDHLRDPWGNNSTYPTIPESPPSFQTDADSLFVVVDEVFTQGDKGLQVALVFIAFSVILHLAEKSRLKAAAA